LSAWPSSIHSSPTRNNFKKKIMEKLKIKLTSWLIQTGNRRASCWNTSGNRIPICGNLWSWNWTNRCQPWQRSTPVGANSAIRPVAPWTTFKSFGRTTADPFRSSTDPVGLTTSWFASAWPIGWWRPSASTKSRSSSRVNNYFLRPSLN
jgi:hypothetical protein